MLRAVRNNNRLFLRMMRSNANSSPLAARSTSSASVVVAGEGAGVRAGTEVCPVCMLALLSSDGVASRHVPVFSGLADFDDQVRIEVRVLVNAVLRVSTPIADHTRAAHDGAEAVLRVSGGSALR